MPAVKPLNVAEAWNVVPSFENVFVPVPPLAPAVIVPVPPKQLGWVGVAAASTWLGATIVLGVSFLICQATEYVHAFHELNLTLATGVYGSTFFMLTGFHGFHVTIGAIMLTVIWFRCLKGHFKPDHHFAFEGVAWYWHFVDVVWLGLFIFVYWL